MITFPIQTDPPGYSAEALRQRNEIAALTQPIVKCPDCGYKRGYEDPSGAICCAFCGLFSRIATPTTEVLLSHLRAAYEEIGRLKAQA